jgi:RNA polymerase sigma-B factor
VRNAENHICCREGRDVLIESNIGLVKHVVRQFTNRGESYDDLVQVASVALVKAADRFDPEKGATFATYGTAMMVGELKRYFRDKSWAVKVPRRLQELHLEVNRRMESLSHELGRQPTTEELAFDLGVTENDVRDATKAGKGFRSISLDAPVPGFDGLSATMGDDDRGFEMVEWRQTLLPYLNRVSWMDRRILQLRFIHGMSQSEIASRVGVSQMKVSRRIEQNLEALRAECAA